MATQTEPTIVSKNGWELNEERKHPPVAPETVVAAPATPAVAPVVSAPPVAPAIVAPAATPVVPIFQPAPVAPIPPGSASVIISAPVKVAEPTFMERMKAAIEKGEEELKAEIEKVV